MGTALSARCLEIISVVRRWPKGLSCWPACQMETFSACHVSTGPTVSACVGTSVMFPPPLVLVADDVGNVVWRVTAQR